MRMYVESEVLHVWGALIEVFLSVFCFSKTAFVDPANGALSG